MEAALECLLPKVLRESIRFEIHQFQCKSAPLQRLEQRLKGYAKFLPQSARVLVLVDRDDDDCSELKRQLEGIACQAGLGTKTRPSQTGFQVIDRIAIEELEAWFFGDWAAVCRSYGRMDPKTTSKAAYRAPDAIAGGTWEALERELQRRGHFKSGLRKIEFARSVAEQMNPSLNKSPSFIALRDALYEL